MVVSSHQKWSSSKYLGLLIWRFRVRWKMVALGDLLFFVKIRVTKIFYWQCTEDDKLNAKLLRKSSNVYLHIHVLSQINVYSRSGHETVFLGPRVGHVAPICHWRIKSSPMLVPSTFLLNIKFFRIFMVLRTTILKTNVA